MDGVMLTSCYSQHFSICIMYHMDLYAAINTIPIVIILTVSYYHMIIS